MNKFELFLYKKKFALIAIVLVFVGFFISNISDSIWVDIAKIILFLAALFVIFFLNAPSTSIPEPPSQEEHREQLLEALKQRQSDPLNAELSKQKKDRIYIPKNKIPENLREQAEIDFTNLVSRTFQIAKSALVADSVGFYLLDPSTKSFTLKESQSDEKRPLSGSVPQGNSLLDTVLQNNRPILENDIPDKSKVINYHSDEDQTYHSFLGAPVHFRDKPIGLVFADSKSKEHFNEKDKIFIENLAATVSDGIISSDRLYETASIARTYSIFVQLNQELSACITKADIFNVIIDYLVQFFHADRLTLSSVLDDTKVVVEKIIGPKDVVKPGDEIDVSEGLAGLVMRQKKALLINNVDSENGDYTPRYYKNEPHSKPMSSFLAVPVIQMDQIAAVIVMEAYQPSVFSENDKDALTALSTNVSLALGRSQMYHRLEEMSIKDEETDTWNFNGLTQRMDEEMSRSMRFDSRLSVVMIDVDNFEQFNHNYGDPATISLLKELARFIKEAIRVVDYLARIGENRFVLILPETSRFGARILTERLRASISEKPFYIEGDIIKISISGGIVEFPEMAADKEELMTKLNKTVVVAKSDNGNKIIIYTKNVESSDGTKS